VIRKSDGVDPVPENQRVTGNGWEDSCSHCLGYSADSEVGTRNFCLHPSSICSHMFNLNYDAESPHCEKAVVDVHEETVRRTILIGMMLKFLDNHERTWTLSPSVSGPGFLWRCKNCGNTEPLLFEHRIHDDFIVNDPAEQLGSHDCDIAQVKNIHES